MSGSPPLISTNAPSPAPPPVSSSAPGTPRAPVREGCGTQLSPRRTEICSVRPCAPSRDQKIVIRGCHPLLPKDAASLCDATTLQDHAGSEPVVCWCYEKAMFLVLHNEVLDDAGIRAVRTRLLKNTVLPPSTLLVLNDSALAMRPLVLFQIALLTLETASDAVAKTPEDLASHVWLVCANVFNRYLGRPAVERWPREGLVEGLLQAIGKDPEDQKLVRWFSRMLVAWMEIGLAPSTVATRVNAASRADVFACLVAGIGNGTGSRHSSARVAAMRLLEECLRLGGNESPDKARAVIQRLIDSDTLIPGWGHYIFKGLNDDGSDSIDPRICVVEEAIRQIYPDSQLLLVLNNMRKAFASGDLTRKGKEFKLPPNSDSYWAVFLAHFFKDIECSQPGGMAEVASIFTIATRTVGLLAHYHEQLGVPSALSSWGFEVMEA